MTASLAKTRFLSRSTVVSLHRESLAEHGGLDGVRDEGLLQSAVEGCADKAGREPEASIPQLAAALAFGLSMNHPFNDGNKRIALIASFVFRELNGHRVEADEVEAYEVFMDLAAGKLTEQELADWMQHACE